ncbi:MAG: hypothetical protein IKC31_03980 [Clostridia bacterium]|nr:hypothetical protein [Clostridia bacterium]
MPRSHGGGFSGGGRSGGGGSFSSGSSSRQSSPRFSTRRPFVGGVRYIYISRGGVRREFYSSEPPKEQNVYLQVALRVLIFAVIVFVTWAMISTVYPSKLGGWECEETGVYYQDDAHIIKDPEGFTQVMKRFYDETGIEPFVYTLTQTQFPSHVYGPLTKYTLEDYAYDQYLDLFRDEGHYMLIFVLLEDGNHLWLDMAGDSTTSLIDDAVFESFQRKMVGRLNQKDVPDQGAVIAACMDEMRTEAFIITSGDKAAAWMIFAIGMIGLIVLVVSTVLTLRRSFMINDYCRYAKDHPGRNSGPDGMGST